jgi:Rrf2 family protein
MLRLSNKERYAIQALFDLAFHQDGQPTQVKDIAERQRIPARFLEQIFQDLKRAGLVESKRGPRGGYQLMRSPKDVCVGDVVRATSGAGAMPTTRRRGRKRANGAAPELREVADAVIEELSRSMQKCLDAITIEDVCTRSERLGIPRPVRPRVVYAI